MEDSIIHKDGLLFRINFGETRRVKYYQILIPKQLVSGVLRSLHGEFGRHPGISKKQMLTGKNNIFQKWRN